MLTRDKIIQKIEQCLNNKITPKELSRWALKHMNDGYEEGFEEIIDDVIYNLELSDNPGFQLSVEDIIELKNKLSEKKVSVK